MTAFWRCDRCESDIPEATSTFEHDREHQLGEASLELILNFASGLGAPKSREEILDLVYRFGWTGAAQFIMDEVSAA